MPSIENDPEKCCYCGACVGVCPTLALELEEAVRITYHKDKCINCLACVKVCPVGAMKQVK